MDEHKSGYMKYMLLVIGVLLVNVGVLNWMVIAGKMGKKQAAVVSSVGIEQCDRECVGEIVEVRLKDWQGVYQNPTSPQTNSLELETLKTDLANANCDVECVEEIIAQKVPAMIKASKSTTSVGTSSSKSGQVRTSFIDLASGSTTGTEWATIGGSEKWLDTALYGTLELATWEGWIEVPGGSGTGRARLYDVTNSRGVDGSEVVITDTEKSSFYSSPLSIWRGQNQYVIQVKSTGGGEVKISNARIKLVTR